MRVRRLLWLIALAVFLSPSFVAPAATARTSHPVMSDCHHDTAPPPCPDEDTAKHAAGLCCPLMAGVVALLPPGLAGNAVAPTGPFGLAAARHLTGLSPHKDPPPPRV